MGAIWCQLPVYLALGKPPAGATRAEHHNEVEEVGMVKLIRRLSLIAGGRQLS